VTRPATNFPQLRTSPARGGHGSRAISAFTPFSLNST